MNRRRMRAMRLLAQGLRGGMGLRRQGLRGGMGLRGQGFRRM